MIYPKVKAAEVYAELAQRGEAKPGCDCHGQPMVWQAHQSVRKGGYWRCAVRLAEHCAARRRARGVLPYAEMKHTYKKETVGYDAAHRRVARRFGKAREYARVDCDSRAQDWSYIGQADDEQVNALGLRYSMTPTNYVPRCKKCHKVHDVAVAVKARSDAGDY